MDNVWTEESWNQFLQELETGQKPKKPLVDDPVEKPSQPIEVLLERELAKLSAELDKDLRAIETRQLSPKVRTSQSPPGGRRARVGGAGSWEVFLRSVGRTQRDLGQTRSVCAL